MNNLKDKNCLVVGGAGFIGSHLCDKLLSMKVKKVVCLDNFFLGSKENLDNASSHRNRFVLYSSDASDYHSVASILDLEKIDIVYNLATKALMYSFENPFDAVNVNIQIALNLAELLRKKKFKRLVQISTSEVYGSAIKASIKETDPLRPETSYASGKAGADLALISYINQFNLDIMILRPFNNYGPRQNTEKFAAIVPITVKRIFNCKKPLIKGNGKQSRDFIYVIDTVEKIIKLSQMRISDRVINIGSGIETEVNEIVSTISSIMNYKKGVIFEKQRIADVNRHKANINILRKYIKTNKTTSLKIGLSLTVDWYKKSFQGK